MTSTTESNIIKILSRLDVPGNAAKIYIFLLKNGPTSGYKITKVSGVNRFRGNNDLSLEQLQIDSSIDIGGLFVDGLGDGLFI